MKRLFDGLLHLTFACIPGCGQMYQGYMNRGISQMLIASWLLGMSILREMWVLWAVFVPVCLYSFFDSFNLRRQLREGIAPEDTYLFGTNEIDARRLNQLMNYRHSLIGWAMVAVAGW